MSNDRPTDRATARPPSAREIAELAARLRRLSAAGPDADPGEREQFLTDKTALLARIPDIHGGAR